MGVRRLYRKHVFGIVNVVLLVDVLTFAFNIDPVRAESRTWHVDDDGGADFARIQDAINVAGHGDSIFVFNGTYDENLVLNKTLSLIGESVDSTIVDGGAVGNGITVIGEAVNIAGFTIRGATEETQTGIFLSKVARCNITNNNIVNNVHGLGLHISSDNNIYDNEISNNTYDGFLARESHSNRVWGNNIADNIHTGMMLSNCTHNIIYCNNIARNNYGVVIEHSIDNKFYHNNLIHNNSVQVHIATSDCPNIWDDGYPFGGNYWSNHSGTDESTGPSQNVSGIDFIVDMPYTIDKDNVDDYPIMGPFGIWIAAGRNVTVFASRLVGLAFENISVEGSVTLTDVEDGPELPDGCKCVGQYFDVQTTADYSGMITVRVVYDNSDVTQEEKYGLRLVQWNSTGASMAGDITGPSGWQDGKVNIIDITLIARVFGATYKDPHYDPRCDLTGRPPDWPDSRIDIHDLTFVAVNYGKTTQQWVDITTRVDMENNVIYGETISLSIFTVLDRSKG